MRKYQPKTLLVVKNRAMGDSIIGLSGLQYLRDILPQTKIIYAVPAWIKPLYDHTQIPADQVISLDLSTASSWYQLWSQLRTLQIDTVFEMFQSGRTAKFFKTWQALGGPTYLFHNHHTSVGNIYDQGVIKPNIQRDLDGLWTYFGTSSQVPQHLNYSPTMTVETQNHDKKIIIGVVATRETKMWPLNYYKDLIKNLRRLKPDHHILIPLGPSDSSIEQELSESTDSHCHLIKTSLRELPTTLQGADLYIGNDTGLKHICVALDIPTYTLFGPEPPLEWHPYDSSKHPYYFREPLECRTLDAHYCGLSQCDSMICLNQMTANDLTEKLQELNLI